jgi:outer membrane lipoprotein
MAEYQYSKDREPTMNRISHLLTIMALLAGCASQPVPTSSPTPDQVRAEPQAYRNQAIRWGGQIVAVDNLADATVIELVHLPLDRNGRPRDTTISSGRFLARFDGFLDPAIHAAGKRLTVTGMVLEMQSGRIGDYPYDYPLVAVDSYRLWPAEEPPQVIYYPPPWWHDDYFFFNSLHWPHFPRPYRR